MPTTSTLETIRRNLDRVRETLSAAADRSGRKADDVTLVAVTKYAEIEWVNALLELGERSLGESRPQQMVERASQFPSNVQWHLIGHLQRNKVRPVLPIADVIHSVDSVRLLDRINSLAKEIGTSPRVLLEVNVSDEAAKDGFAADELLRQAAGFSQFEHVRIDGLMTMAPFADDVETARPIFARLRELAGEVRARVSGIHSVRELSMGMSRDFTVAIEEGATIIRVGRTLFEGLERPAS